MEISCQTEAPGLLFSTWFGFTAEARLLQVFIHLRQAGKGDQVMRRSQIAVLSCLVLLSAVATACNRAQSPAPPLNLKADTTHAELFAALPDSVPAADGAAGQALVDLGRMLYYEPRLSKSQQISCNSCHDLAKYGVDGQPTSDGHKGQKGDQIGRAHV
jgi:hypothetical protein